ncbi:MAG: ABC transporter ATP-binding protein [Pseudomonadota bacterium]
MTPRHKHPSSWTIIRRFSRFYLTDRAMALASYGMALLAASAALAAVFPLKYVIDAVLLDHSAPGPVDRFLDALSKPQAVIALALASAALAALAALTSALEKNLNARLRERMTARLRAAILADMLERPISDLAPFKSGEVALRLVDDTGQVARLFCKTAPVAFRHAVTTLMTLGAMITLNPAIGAIGLIVITLLAIFVRSSAGRLQATSREKRRREGAVAGFAQEIIRNIRFVRAVGGEASTRERFESRNTLTLAAGVEETRAAVRLEQRMQIANGLAVAILTGAGALLTLKGALSVGDLALSLSLLNQLLKPVEKINDLASSITGALVRAERLDAFLGRAIRPVASLLAAPAARDFQGALRLDTISFAHEPGVLTLEDVSFSVAPGECVWLRGASGAGKSTLIDIILRLYEPQKGRLSLGGVSARDIAPRDWRAAFAVMLQERRIFSGAVRDAITFANDPLSDAEIWAALSDASIAEKVARIPGGLDAEIGEAGENFSGGERARLCLARALAGKGSILILDEPLANLDAGAQHEVIAAIRRMRARRTILIVSHHHIPSDMLDRTILLDGGRVREGHIERAAS